MDCLQKHKSQVEELSQHEAFILAIKCCSQTDWKSTTFAATFLAANNTTFRVIVATWPRITTLVQAVIDEADAMVTKIPKVASPIMGPLFDFLSLQCEMIVKQPASRSTQHLARAIIKPTWINETSIPVQARTSLHNSVMY